MNIVNEHIINLISADDKLKYADVVWDILQKSYEKIGGFKSASNKEELINDSFMWKLKRRNNRITAVMIFKKKFGRKSIAGGTDGTRQGKSDFFELVKQDVQNEKSWSEVSGKMESLKLRYGAKPVPNRYAAEITGKKIISLHPDGFHYTRMIGGEPHEKMIVGKVEGYS